MVEEAYELSKADIGEVDKTQGSGSKATLVDLATRQETTVLGVDPEHTADDETEEEGER